MTAGIIGVILTSRLRIGSPIIAEGFELDAIAACAIGGISLVGGEGRLSGAIIGALILTVIRNGLTIIGMSSFWQKIVMGLIIIIVVAIDMSKKKKAV